MRQDFGNKQYKNRLTLKYLATVYSVYLTQLADMRQIIQDYKCPIVVVPMELAANRLDASCVNMFGKAASQ